MVVAVVVAMVVVVNTSVLVAVVEVRKAGRKDFEGAAFAQVSQLYTELQALRYAPWLCRKLVASSSCHCKRIFYRLARVLAPGELVV